MKEEYKSLCERIEALSGYGKCFDVNKKELYTCKRRGSLYFISSLSDGLLLNRVVELLLLSDGEYGTMSELASHSVALSGCAFFNSDNIDEAIRFMLSGTSLLIIEGYDEIAVLETRALPGRSVAEPESDHVLKGPHDGFCESLNINVGLLRRRIRSADFRIDRYPVGRESKTDVALCYMEGKVDKKFLRKLTENIKSIDVEAISLGQQSIAECLIKHRWYNIFPKFRYTERPDAASAMIMEGSIILLCDTTPQAMILPTAIFDFLQESDDFYFPPLIGTYLRAVRITVFMATLFFTPIWYFMNLNPQLVPEALLFMVNGNRGGIPLIWQLLLVEFMIDALKLASLNTPSTLGNSLSVVAGLIIGDFAVETGWLSSDVILYMAFVAMANFAQPSFELGYAFKFARIALIILVELFGIAGLIIGAILLVLAVALNKTVDGSRSYLYPLVPFNKNAMIRQIFRVKLSAKRKKAPSEREKDEK